jgi:hypothetical protein
MAITLHPGSCSLERQLPFSGEISTKGQRRFGWKPRTPICVATHFFRGKRWRRGSESNRRIKVLQTSPLPLGYRAILDNCNRPAE